MTSEIALIESASLRREHIDRTDVLDKVKALSYLPDGLHVDRAGVAFYYEVPEATIKKLAQRHADELESNGMRSVAGQEFRDMLSPNSGLGRGRPSTQIFTKRTLLNVGMLLRDSEVARRVRSFLLDAGEQKLSRKELALFWYEAEERAEIALERATEAEARAEVAETFKRAIEGNDGLSITEFGKKYFSAVRARDLDRHLYRKNYLIDQSGAGTWDEKRNRYRDGWQHRFPGANGREFLYRHSYVDAQGVRRQSTHVLPGERELAFRDRLVRDGLQSNEQPGLFAIEGGAA